jgi:hypothetical protein
VSRRLPSSLSPSSECVLTSSFLTTLLSTTCKLNDQIRSQANWYYNLNASSPCTCRGRDKVTQSRVLRADVAAIGAGGWEGLMFESLYRICKPSFNMFSIQDGGFE